MSRYAALRSQMADNAAAMTTPEASAGGEPIRISRGATRDAIAGLHPFIDPWMVEAFAALTQEAGADLPFDLVPCTMNGNPAVLIAQIAAKGGKLHITPLFMAVQPWMTFGPPADD